jgi:NAD(P)-dependent dehydrogenase (short-subunit alcohol dehydrogenase family)
MKDVPVTGGYRAIGRAIVAEFSIEGYAVIFTYPATAMPLGNCWTA